MGESKETTKSGKSSRHEKAAAAGGSNGALEDFPSELRAQATAALEAEAQSIDRGIDAWKKIVAGAATEWAPRRELARVYRRAERWKACVEILKEGVDKATWPAPELKVPVLMEMVELYRDRLKLDVMVVNAFNQILAIVPNDVEAMAALAAQYQAMGRWQELIALLRRQASAVDSKDERMALNLRVGALYLEKFSNQAEAIKAFEAVLELEPGHIEAVAQLRQMYEKRRDWDKLVALQRQEIENIADGKLRLRRWADVARLATEKLKKPLIGIDLWQKVLAEDAADAEALGELEKLYERERMWPELAAVLDRQIDLLKDAGKRSAALTKLGLLHTERTLDVKAAIKAWEALLAIEPDNRRGQDALKKLHLQNKDWGALEGFFAAQKKWDEFVRVLERQADVEDDASVKVDLSNRIGVLYRDHLGKADKAQKAFERTLSVDPQNLLAAEALVPVYEKAKDAKHLAAVLQVELLHTTDAAQRQSRMQRIVELLETDVGDKGAAASVALQAFAEDPASAWTRAAAERLAEATGQWAPLAEAYEKALSASEGTAALPLLATLARAYERETPDPPRAIARNQSILALDPDNADALAALERLYIATEATSDLLAVYERQRTRTRGGPLEREVLGKLAALHEEHLRDPDKAIEIHLQVLKLDGKEDRSLRALDRLYRATGRWQELADTIEKELALSSDAAASAELKFRLGEARAQHLDDPDGALTAYAEAVAIDGRHAGARAGLEGYLSDKKRQMKAVAALEPIYEAAQELTRLVETHRIRLEREKSGSQRVALLRRIGTLEAGVARGEASLTAYADAFREDPSSTETRVALEETAAKLGAWEALVTLYTDVQATGKLAPALERDLLIAVASTYDERLGRADKAVEFFQKAQEIEPEDPSALEALERLYTRTERWTDLVETLKRKATLVPGAGEREAVLTRVATLWEEILANPDEAIGAWKEVLAQNPANLGALRALDRLFVQKDLSVELADNLQRQLELGLGQEDTVRILSRLGQLREQKLRDLGSAIETFRRLLELSPGHADTVAALERMLPRPEHELAIADLLEPVYRAQREFRRLAEVQEIEARHALDPRKKLALLLDVALTYEDGLDDPERAYDALGRALAESPLDEETQRRIERLARVLARFDDLVARYGALVDTLPSDELKRSLHHKMAGLAEQALGRDDLAASAYLKALEVAPRDLEAAAALERIYVRNSDYAQLVLLLIRKIDMVDDLAQKKELGLKAAQAYEEVLEQVDKAIDVYRQVLALDDTDRGVLDHLERLYVRLGRWSDLKDVYTRKAELAASPAEKKQMLFVLGQVYDRELSSPERAIDTYQSILDLDPEDLEALQALDRLYLQTSRWYDLLGVLEREAEAVQAPAEVLSLRFRIGELWRENLKDPARATEAYRQVLASDPMHDPTLRALEAMMAAGEEAPLAAQVLQPIYEQSGEWERVVAVYEVMAKHADDPVRKTDLLAKIADIQERRLANFEAAFEATLRAFRADVANPDVVAHLHRLAEASGRWADLAAAYEAEIEKVMDSRLQVEMLLRLGRIYEEEVQDSARAIATYRRVADTEPDRKESLLALDRLYSSTEKWAELSEILRREIRLADSDAQIIELTFKLAQVLEVAVGDLPRAVEAYQEILVADPQHADTRAALERLLTMGQMQHEIAQVLEPLYRLGEEWDKLADIYQLDLERLTDPEERQQILRRLAEIAENKLVDQVAAFEWWSKALIENPSSDTTIEELQRLARATHQWDRYVAAMREAAKNAREQGVRHDLLLRLAGVVESELGDLPRTEEILREVLDENAGAEAALASLDRVLDRQGNFDQLATVLRQRIGLTDDSKELVALHLRLGKVLADVLGDADGAIASYLAVLEHDSRSADGLAALEQLYFRGQRWQELLGVYEKLCDIAPGDQVLSECYARMALLTSEVLGQREKGIDLWRKVLDLRGPDLSALQALADLYEQAGEWHDLTEALGGQVHALQNPGDKIPVLKRLGRVWGEKLGRERNALECWQAVLAIDPEDFESLRAIADNYRTAGAWEELAETLGRLIQLGPDHVDVEVRKGLFAQLGELEGSTLMRADRAIEAWGRVLEIDPADFRALAALEALYAQAGRWEDCVRVLEQRAAALATPGDQIDVFMQVASIWMDKIGDGGAAAEVYERILAVDAGHAAASHELGNLYHQRKSWVKLVDLLLARTEFVAEPSERVKVFLELAEVYEKQLKDNDRAFVALQAAFREDFSDDQVAKELERLASAAGKWNELISDYTQLVQGLDDRVQQAELWVKIARWYDTALGHVEYAITSAQQALALDSSHVGALSVLEDFYRKQARWRDLVKVLGRHAEVEADSVKRVDILLALADAYDTQLGDSAQATAAYEQALTVDERCLEALDALERLYRRMGAWDRLVDVLHKKSQTVDDGELAIKLRLQVAELWEERLGDSGRAVDAYREVLSVDPQNLPALKALERLYEKTGRMEDYLEVIEHQLEVMGSDEDRVGLLARMAQVWEEQFGKNDRAIDCLNKILHVDERNLKAYRDLDRLLRAERNWDGVVENYRRHILVAPDAAERTELYLRMGAAYERELRDLDRAIEAYGDVLSVDPEHADALRGLARLYEETEAWERAVEVMERLEVTASGAEKVDLNYRLGKIFDEHLRVSETAEERLAQALAVDPKHVPSMLALLALYRRRGDALKAAQLMVRAEAHTTNVLEKTKLLFEAGKVYQTEIGDEAKATELYARTLELDPEHVEAAEPLSEIYFQGEQWAALVPLLEMLVRKADRRAHRELAVQTYRLARACEQQGDIERALRSYKQSFDLDATHLPTLMGRANLLYGREQWDEAFKLYQTILVHHRESQKDSDIVEIFHRLGQIKLKVGERAKALNFFEKAIEIQPGHGPTLDALVELHGQAGDWEAVIRQKRAMLVHAAEVDEKLALFDQIIAIYKDTLKNPQKAIAACLEALEVRPNSRPLLHGVLELFSETKQWKKAVEILVRLADSEKGKVRAKYLEAAGNITNYELHSSDEAVEFYNQSLDEDPDSLKIFERLDKIMTGKKDWKNQERAYRRMIKRLGTDVTPERRQTQIQLWYGLGEIYRSRLKDLRAATQAFEVCVGLDPDTFKWHQILAELYQLQGPSEAAKAIREYRFMIQKAKDFADMAKPMKTLRRLFTEIGQHDHAWCVASALTLIRQADPEEQRFYEQYRSKGLARARARLNEEMWQKSLYHPDEDRFISNVLAAVGHVVLLLHAKEHKEWGLKRKDRRDPANDQLLFSKVFNYVSQVLNIHQPELYLRPESPGELDLANAKEKNVPLPSFVVGAGLLQGRGDKELAYALGKKLALMRPEHLARWPHVVPTMTELKVIFLAALRLTQPAVPVKPELEASVAQYKTALAALVPPQLLEQLGVVVQRFLQSKTEADLNRWSNAVDFTATRAGFLMCNDLDVAVRMVQAEPVTVGSADPKDKIRDLVQWSISEEYFTLRDQLGLAIG